MCGLFGWIVNSHTVKRDTRAALGATLAIMNDARGGHSFGFWDGKQIVRALGNMADGATVTELSRAHVMLAHTRFATTGATTVENSHPFHIGSVIGAHNGIVSNHWQLNHKHNRTCAVDSEHIFYNLNEGLSLKEIDAYGAIVWYDGKGLHAGRFNGGSLSIAKIDGGVIWSSEEKHLRKAINLAAVKLRFLYTVKEGQSYRLSVEGIERHKPLPFDEPSWRVSLTDGVDWYAYGKEGSKATSTPRETVTPSVALARVKDTRRFSHLRDAHLGATEQDYRRFDFPIPERLPLVMRIDHETGAITESYHRAAVDYGRKLAPRTPDDTDGNR